jgi:dihydroorotase
MRLALEYSRKSGLPIIDHCEDPALSQGGVMNEGPLAARLGLRGIPAAAEERMISRDIELAKETGGRIHIAHVSTAGSVNLIRRARYEGVSVTAEVTPHHLTLTEEMVTGCNTAAKVNPPLRTAEDIEALVLGLKEGVIDAVATDHAPHTDGDKMCDFNRAAFGISGFETALGSLMGLVHGGKIDLMTLISKLTNEPASFLKRPDLGTLEPGVAADITVFDPREEWVVNPGEFASKGRNTPLAGHVLRGRVVLTIVAGAIVYGSSHLSISTRKAK